MWTSSGARYAARRPKLVGYDPDLRKGAPNSEEIPVSTIEGFGVLGFRV